MRSFIRSLTLAAVALPLATPALAAPARRLAIGDVFGHAAIPIQAVALVLIAILVAAPALLVLGRGAYLGALAKGAPPLAIAASLFTLMAGCVGIANSPVVPSLTVLAPAFAEALFLLILGALAAFSAVVCRELAKPRATT